MSWIILALTLGASITSIIHGVFMLFGSLSITGAAIPGIPSTMLASLPVVSAIFALIGGIIAFNQNKWGALFLFIAMGLCAATRDTWLYAGLYFFAGVFCFLLRPKQQNDYDDYIYGDEEDEEYDEPEDGESDKPYAGREGKDFYYEDEPPEQINTPPGERRRHSPFRRINHDMNSLPEVDDSDIGLQLNMEPAKVRRRITKSCPECGAIVSRDESICSNCGAKLFVAPDDINTTEPLMPVTPADDDKNLQTVSEHLASPVNINDDSEKITGIQDVGDIEDFNESNENISPEIASVEGINLNEDLNEEEEYGEMSTVQTAAPNYRVIKPRRNERIEQDYEPQRVSMKKRNSRPLRMNSMNDEAAYKYQAFSQSKIAQRAKKRKKRSGLRKIMSMLLLVGAVGGALYFLLGLRKLPPGDLPPMARTEIVSVNSGTSEQEVNVTTNTGVNDDTVAVAVDVPVNENVLPNFIPEREPKSGTIIGSNVNVRADHTTSSSRVTRLNVGSRVEITGSFNVPSGKYSGIWYSVRTGNNDGWIYGKYVQPVGSGLPSGYSNGLLKSFGSSLTQLVESFGQPSRKTSSSAEWSGLTATLRGEDITRIRLTNSSRELQNGLKVGMSRTALLQIMGYPSSVNNRTLNYNENGKTGLSVQMDKNDSISSITVNEIQ
ncbi:MAG: SH3 domain-containing protein [Synergistaceae bacterium]|nr:SH3 domain-containing protein [Synergistaceae bacterium]